MAVVTRHHQCYQRTAAAVRCLSSHAVCDDAVFMTCSVARRLLAVWPHAVSHLQYRAGTIAFEIQISHTCTVGREKSTETFFHWLLFTSAGIITVYDRYKKLAYRLRMHDASGAVIMQPLRVPTAWRFH